MRPYITLLRLPYQLQLGPIFAWGFMLAGGRFDSPHTVATFILVFLAFHVGAFGGLTALNSFYDRDTGPIGGLWQPPPVPARLGLFAWCVQIGGWLLLWGHGHLQVIYAAIVLLAFAYSHPRWRWKGHAWKSWATVALGQGVLDYSAGVFLAEMPGHWNEAMLLGLWGATLFVLGLYPLTQLFQIEDDRQRGDCTLAVCLVERWGRRGVLGVAAALFGAGLGCNAGAVWAAGRALDAALMLLAGIAPGTFLWNWMHAPGTPQDDFRRVHQLMRGVALAFGAYTLWRLWGG